MNRKTPMVGGQWAAMGFALVSVVFSLGVASTSSVAAGPNSQMVNEPYSQYVERQRQDRTWLFLGLGGGYANLSTVPLPEKTKTGFNFDLYAGLSFFSPHWIVDAGGGWFYNKISSDDTLGVLTRVITRGVYLEASPRYRLSDEWSLGPVVQGIFSTDTTFSESEINKTSASVLVGGRLMYEWPVSNLMLLRLGVQATTDLTIQDRQMWLFQGLAQIGFPLGREARPHDSPPPPPPEARPAPLPVVAVKGPARIVDEKTILVSLDERLILFPTNKAALRSPYTERLREFARVLVDDLNTWGNVRVEGHSDIRGTRKRNIQLSFERASTVGQFMIQNGVPNRRVEAKGFGPDQPLDPANNQIAWAKNRRVELVIANVKDVKRLAERINQIWPEDAPVPLLVDKPKAKKKPAKRGSKKKPAQS